MLDSLFLHAPDTHLFIICLDDKSFKYFSTNTFSNTTPIPLKEVEAYYDELIPAKNNRTYIEYIFTLSPVLALYIFEKYNYINIITTLDADIFFFSDPSVLFTDFDSYSIGITPHRFDHSLKYLEKYGKYNVSFQTFKNDDIGIACLKKWKDNCIEWCYDKYENNKFADQKYLDDWCDMYQNIKIFNHEGVAAPWNVIDQDISVNNKGVIMIKNEPLIFYHFHGVRNISNTLLSFGLSNYLVIKRTKVVKYIYLPYIQRLLDFQSVIGFGNYKIRRGMHPLLGILTFIIFLGDLYRYKNGRLARIYNLNIIKNTFSYFRKTLWLWHKS